MPLLVGEGIEGHPQHLGEHLALGGSRQEAGHIGALHRPGAGAGPHGLDGPQASLSQQRFHHLRQVLHMLKEGVALAQAQLPRAHLQQPSLVSSPLPVKHGGGGGIVAGVQPQYRHGSGLPAGGFLPAGLRLRLLLNGLVRQLGADKGAQNPVDERGHLLGLVLLGQLHGGVNG